MTEARREVSYATGFLPVIGYPILMAWHLCRNPPDFMFALVVGALFYAMYVVPLMLVQGKIEPTDRGVSVERWSKWSIEYSDVVACFGLFLIPFHIAILITRRPFPHRFVITGDEIEGRPRSLFQRGRLASAVLAKKALHGQQ
jgi:hypothetical protein